MASGEGNNGITGVLIGVIEVFSISVIFGNEAIEG